MKEETLKAGRYKERRYVKLHNITEKKSTSLALA